MSDIPKIPKISSTTALEIEKLANRRMKDINKRVSDAQKLTMFDASFSAPKLRCKGDKMIVGRKTAKVIAKQAPDEFKGPHDVELTYYADGSVDIARIDDDTETVHCINPMDFDITFEIVEE